MYASKMKFILQSCYERENEKMKIYIYEKNHKVKCGNACHGFVYVQKIGFFHSFWVLFKASTSSTFSMYYGCNVYGLNLFDESKKKQNWENWII
jgi:hypothetical protein